ncbi:MAG: outer membrane beta-barrel protein, partial [Verrucomicrobia bacterium]|nr:outer membrane beta-barrel protein [Cytophagales bacterium]
FYKGLPFGLSYERGITDQISIGGFLDYSSTKYGYTGFDGKLTILFVGARASYHFNEILDVKNDKVDLYGGVALGFRSVSWKYNDPIYDDLYSDPYSNGVLFGVHAGARYMFANNIGGFAELGYGVSILKLGLAVKF